MADVSECGQMVGFLGAVHAFGGEDACSDFFIEEVVDEGAGDAVVEELFFAGI